MPSINGSDIAQMVDALSSSQQIRSQGQVAVAAKGKEVMQQQGRNAVQLIESAATGKGFRIDARA